MKGLVFSLLIAVSGCASNQQPPIARSPSSVDHVARGGCLIGLQGALLRIGRGNGKATREMLLNECDRLLKLSGASPYQESERDVYAYGCGVGAGAVFGAALGKQKVGEMASSGQLDRLIKSICFEG